MKGASQAHTMHHYIIYVKTKHKRKLCDLLMDIYRQENARQNKAMGEEWSGQSCICNTSLKELGKRRTFPSIQSWWRNKGMYDFYTLTECLKMYYTSRQNMTNMFL